MSGRYASYWNAFLFNQVVPFNRRSKMRKNLDYYQLMLSLPKYVGNCMYEQRLIFMYEKKNNNFVGIEVL